MAQHQDAPPSHPQGGTLLLARCVILEGFPSIPGIDPVGRSVTVLLGLWQREHRGKKHTMRRMEGGFGEGFGVGATPAKPSLLPGGGWAWLEMPSEEMGLRGARLGGGGRTVLAKAELERLDLSPNPVTLIPIFHLNVAKSIYFPLSPLI